MSAPYTDLKSLSHAGLADLLDYDSRHGTTFSQSLKTYLNFNRNITNSAKALHLHRNTMLYHMKRAEEIMDANLSDADTLLHIEISYRFLEYDLGLSV
jgi:DNA-binding PucR family transcriptional regulator